MEEQKPKEETNNAPKGNLDALRARVVELSTKKKGIRKKPPIAPKKEEKKESLLSKFTGSSVLKPIRTYKGDIEETVQDNKTSVVGAVAAEQRKRARTKIPTPKISRSATRYFLIALSGILIILGAALLIYFLVILKPSDEVIPKQEIPTFIFTEEQRGVEITNKKRRDILRTLTDKKNSVSVSLGGIEQLYLTEEVPTEEGRELKLVSARDFFNKIEARAPGSFTRSLSEEFVLGAHVFDGNEPFIILKTSFYENAFAGMLEWEKFMNEDLAPLFGPLIEVNTDTTTLPNFEAPFVDRVIRNKEVRILKNGEEDAILYSFVDQNTIVLTTNEATFVEILTRLTAQRI